MHEKSGSQTTFLDPHLKKRGSTDHSDPVLPQSMYVSFNTLTNVLSALSQLLCSETKLPHAY